MDLIRQLLGFDKIDYVGYSGGTWLGAYYQTYFPQHVGRFVLDSNTDFTQPWINTFVAQPQAFERRFREDFATWAAKYDGEAAPGPVTRRSHPDLRAVTGGAEKATGGRGVPGRLGQDQLRPEHPGRRSSPGICIQKSTSIRWRSIWHFSATFPRPRQRAVPGPRNGRWTHCRRPASTSWSSAPTAAPSGCAPLRPDRRGRRRERDLHRDHLQRHPLAARPRVRRAVGRPARSAATRCSAGRMTENPCFYWDRPNLTMPTPDRQGLADHADGAVGARPGDQLLARRRRPPPVRRIAPAHRHPRGRPRRLRRREQVRGQDRQHLPHHREGAGQGHQLRRRGHPRPVRAGAGARARAASRGTPRARHCAGSRDSPKPSRDICTDSERTFECPTRNTAVEFRPISPTLGQIVITVGEIPDRAFVVRTNLSGRCQGSVPVRQSVISTTLSQRGGTGRRPGGLDGR